MTISDDERVAEVERVRVARLREDASRPASENLREAIELSHKLLEFVGAAAKR